LEADRKQKWCGKDVLPNAVGQIIRFDDKRFKIEFEVMVKSSFEDEIADTIIRLLDLCAAHDIDIDWHIKAKLRYNRLRPAKHGKAY